jgi:hypothetical protein
LCLLIFAFRRFFIEPISSICIPAYRLPARNMLPPQGSAIRCEDQPIVANCHTVRDERATVKSVCDGASGALGCSKAGRVQPKSEGPKAETRKKSEPIPQGKRAVQRAPSSKETACEGRSKNEEWWPGSKIFLRVVQQVNDWRDLPIHSPPFSPAPRLRHPSPGIAEPP